MKRNRSIGNRNLPFTYTKEKIFVESTEMTSSDFLVICHSFYTKKSGFIFIPHMHTAFEILYVEKGYPTYQCNDKSYKCRPGDFMIFNSMDTHACMYAEAPYKTRTIQFEKDMLSSRFLDVCEKEFIVPIFTKKILFKNYIGYNEEFHEIFSQIEQEYFKKGSCYELLIKGYLYKMLVWLYRNALEKHDTTKNRIIISQNQERYNQMLKFIDENYTQEISTEEIAKNLFIDKSYAIRIFKSYSGMTITKYVNTKRILFSVSLLRETQLTVSQIAMMSGFFDINYFSRLFKRIVGVSPKVFRNS